VSRRQITAGTRLGDIVLKLLTLGRLELNDAGIPLLARRRKELVLLAVIARRTPRSVPRAELAALLWGAKDETRARQSLRQALLELRRVLGDGIEVTAERVRLEPGSVDFDLRRFEDSLDAGDPAAAVALANGEFLPGAEDLGDEELRGWIERERASLRERLASAYARLVDESRSASRSKDEIRYALAWSEALPHDERAHHALVDALRSAGRAAEARARHAAFVSILREDLGATPSKSFGRLGESLRVDPANARIGARGLLTPDLVARGGALGRLAAMWRSVCAGHSAVVVLVGDEGMGKSRLCRDFIGTVRESGKRAIVLDGHAFESEREREWSTLRGAFRKLADAPGLVAAPASALAALAAISPEIAERFPRLAAAGHTMPAEEGVVRVLSEVTVETPLLVVVDDATSADTASSEVLSALIRRPPAGSLLLLSARPESIAGSPLAADLRQAGSHVTVIELQPLGIDDVEMMAGSMMPLAPECSRALAERLHRESAGNPAQVEWLVSTWADVGVLNVGADGRWIPTQALDSELPIPTGIRESLAERMRRLSPESRQVGEAVSVWARAIEPATLEATAGVHGDRFAAALGELLGRRLLRESVGRPGSHEFVSEVMRRAVYDGLAPSRRRALHRAAARALRSLPPGPARDVRMQEHVAHGGQLAGRRRWIVGGALAAGIVALAAGRMAASRSAAVPTGARVVLADVENTTNDSSLGRTFYSAATISLLDSRHVTLFPRSRVRETLARMRRLEEDSAFTEQLAREVALRESLASVIVLGVSQVDSTFLLTGRFVDPVVGADLGARSVRVTGRGALLGGLDRLLAMVRRDLGESRLWLRDSTPPLPRVTTSSLEALRAFFDGRDAYSRQDFSGAREHFERAIAIDTAFALAHAFLSDVHWFGRSDRAAAKAALDRALALTDRLTERERLRVRGQMADRFGDPADANASFQMLAERYPDRSTWFTLGNYLFRQRRCGEAIVALRRSLAFDSLYHIAHIDIAKCLLLGGDAEGALVAFAAAERADSLALIRGTTNHDWGTAFVRAGRPAAAESVFRLMLTRPGAVDRFRGHRSLAWLATYRGQYRAAVTHLRQGISINAQSGLVLAEVRDRVVLARVLTALGDRAGAAAQLDTVAALAGKARAFPDLQVHIGLAALELGRRSQARAAAAAIDAADSLGVRDTELARRAVESALLLAGGDAVAAKQVADAEHGHLYRVYRHGVRARAFAALGQLDSAVVAARGVSDAFAFGGEEQFEWMQGLLRLGEYSEARGDTAAALDAYARFAQRWADGDPDLRDLGTAWRGVARLTGQRSSVAGR
jgi:DNA-binding SARP family transcriptional activator/tetratricopeptide (TPR) repeat protein